MDSMTNIGPLPRLRLYTGLGHYTTLATGIAGPFGADRGQIPTQQLCGSVLGGSGSAVPTARRMNALQGMQRARRR